MKKELYEYPPVEQWKWRSYDGTKSINIDEFIASHQDCNFYIGTDSDPVGNHTNFATCLIARLEVDGHGKGGYIIVSKQRTAEKDAKKLMRPRLISEAMRSLSLAYYLDTRIPPDDVIHIHLDVNPCIDFKSNQCYDQMVGMIMSQGIRFKPVCKPNSWAATKVADRKTK